MPHKGRLTIKTAFIKATGIVEVSIADTGIGIKREYLDKLSEPFFTTKSPERGIGLGLTIAYGIVAHHRGKINVKSVPGTGTTFTVQLPIIV
jgi:signal transduction histidine kinase